MDTVRGVFVAFAQRRSFIFHHG
jgi:hypothetical protein